MLVVATIQINQFREWVGFPENNNQVLERQLQVVFNELEVNTVCISAANVSPVPYSLLANVS